MARLNIRRQDIEETQHSDGVLSVNSTRLFVGSEERMISSKRDSKSTSPIRGTAAEDVPGGAQSEYPSPQSLLLVPVAAIQAKVVVKIVAAEAGNIIFKKTSSKDWRRSREGEILIAAKFWSRLGYALDRFLVVNGES